MIGGYRNKAEKVKILNKLEFKALEGWVGFALIDLLKILKGPCPAEIIKSHIRGQVTDVELSDLLSVLCDLGLVRRTKGNLFATVSQDTYVRNYPDMPSEMGRRIYRNYLKRAIEAIDEQGVFEREFSSRTFIMSRKEFANLQRRVRNFLEQITSEFMVNLEGLSSPETAVLKTEDYCVYQFNIQIHEQSK